MQLLMVFIFGILTHKGKNMPSFSLNMLSAKAGAHSLSRCLQLFLISLFSQNAKNILYFMLAFPAILFSSVSFAQLSNIALHRPSVALSEEGPGNSAAKAFDGKRSTRWASEWSGTQWIYVDLGESLAISRVVLRWETAFSKAYEIQTSNDKKNWHSVYATVNGDGGTDDIDLTGAGRYIRLYMTTRATEYGYSLWDFEVYEKIIVTPLPPPDANKALNKLAIASSDESAVWRAGQAVDGDDNTRWASNRSDAQWIYVDLGVSQRLNRIVLKWEAAYASDYLIQASEDKLNWTTLKTMSNADGGIDDLNVSGAGRYVRMLGTKRATGYGYSLWGFEVY